MRIVLCDGDDLLRSMVEVMVERTGHDLVGVADTAADAVGLLQMAKPDAAIIDLALGVNADFDIVETALSVGAQVIVFSRTAYAEMLDRYPERPVVVPKPDLDALEHALQHLGDPSPPPPPVVDRRRRPGRDPIGPSPTGVSDAQAFYEALNGAVEGDGLLWIDLTQIGTGSLAATELAERVMGVMRGADRILASPEAIRVFLLGSAEEGITAFCRRLADAGVLAAEAPMRSVVVGADEAPSDAFDRLKRS
jgi:CheY-like chemotaxis protein